jgi:transcriptional regulator with XRE-family HTH domain
MGRNAEPNGLAVLLLALKERSGLSYGVLARRLHLSTSTVHRYCSGETVPLDYAPVERFARLCRATSAELVELHRRWETANEQRLAARPEPAASESLPSQALPSEPLPAETGPAEPPAAPGPPVRRRRRTVAVLATAGLVLAAATTVVVIMRTDDSGRETALHPVDAPVTSVTSTAPTTSAIAPSHSPAATAHRTSPPAAATHPATTEAAASAPASADTSLAPGPPPVNVTVEPFTSCHRSILVNRPPAQVPPPVSVQDTSAWVRALDGVTAKFQQINVTVQGTGSQTVVLEALHVRTTASAGLPTAGTVYELDDGCGGGVGSTLFTLDLDAAHPEPVAPRVRPLPRKVSQGDPEVLIIDVQALAHDVTWYLELDWASGNRHGTLKIDDHGRPFHTTGTKGRPLDWFDHTSREWAQYPDPS